MMFDYRPTHRRGNLSASVGQYSKNVSNPTVKSGPVETSLPEMISIFKISVPKWNRLDGGRYVLTYAGVTKDPDTDVHNVGIYRGMVGGPAEIPVLLWRAQHWGIFRNTSNPAAKCRCLCNRLGAFSYSWRTSSTDISEYDVMGAIRGEPVDLVDCETVPLKVPASV